MYRLVGALLLSLCGFQPGPGDDPGPAERARQQAEKHMQAYARGDYVKYVDGLHPKEVERRGGRDILINDLHEVSERVLSMLNFSMRIHKVQNSGAVIKSG